LQQLRGHVEDMGAWDFDRHFRCCVGLRGVSKPRTQSSQSEEKKKYCKYTGAPFGLLE
jgi:hypothetical protein